MERIAMSRTSRFFRYLWRANALLIFAATAGIGLLLLSIVASELRWDRSRQQADEVAPVVADPTSDESFHLGSLDPVEGTDVLRGELYTLRKGGGVKLGSSDYRGAETRNLLYLDTRSRTSRWLLPDNRRVVTRRLDVSGSETEKSSKV